MNQTALTIDTLKIVHDLEAAGVDRKQAEATAEAISQAITAGLGELATKADLATGLAALEASLIRTMLIMGVALFVGFVGAFITIA